MGYQNNFLLLGNASYLNRGCEAILRGTVKILRSAFGECRFVNANFDVIDPPFTPVESDPDVVHHPLPTMRRLTAKWVAVQAADRLCPLLGHYMRFGPLREEILQSKAALSIGGDNYTLDYGIPWKFVNLDRYVLARSKPLIIWGASVGPFDKKPDFAKIVHEHLKHEVTAIFVREKRSYNYLAKHGISDNVHLMFDPAFLMEAKPVSSNEIGFEIPDDAIGFNLSPLMSHYIGDNKLTTLTDTTVNLIEAIHLKLHHPIILIPHVTSPHSNDYELLREIHERLVSKFPACVYVLPDSLNAAETKWVISKLSCLIAARTHATIAGFSTRVPTVSLAYSVKAFGINEELFGHTDYVIRPEEFSAESIMAKTELVLAGADEIRDILSDKMAYIRTSALAAGAKLKELIGNHDE
jgi:colanic acid/amylovoran biosynthesis protein